jgi:hypothetical protein
MVSSLEEFRRATSRVATFTILISIPLFIISNVLPRFQFLRGIPVLIYLIFALVLEVTIRRSAVNSLTAVRVIEIVFFAALLTATVWVVYFAWMNGIEGLIPSIIDGLMLTVVAVIVQKNIAKAKSMASQVAGH